MKLLWRSHGCKPAFLHPGGASPRTAVILDTLYAKSPSRTFDPADPYLADSLEAFRPASLAASYNLLIRLAPRFRPDHSVIVFTAAGAPPLTPDERDQLWDIYEVPVFEQLLDAQGNLLASECEAHDGLHLVSARCPFETAGLIEGRCGCDSESRRATSVFPVTRPCAVGNGCKVLAAHAAS